MAGTLTRKPAPPRTCHRSPPRRPPRIPPGNPPRHPSPPRPRPRPRPRRPWRTREHLPSPSRATPPQPRTLPPRCRISSPPRRTPPPRMPTPILRRRAGSAALRPRRHPRSNRPRPAGQARYPRRQGRNPSRSAQFGLPQGLHLPRQRRPHRGIPKSFRHGTRLAQRQFGETQDRSPGSGRRRRSPRCAGPARRRRLRPQPRQRLSDRRRTTAAAPDSINRMPAPASNDSPAAGAMDSPATFPRRRAPLDLVA